MLAAVPRSKEPRVVWTCPGEKVNSVDPTLAPSTSAQQIAPEYLDGRGVLGPQPGILLPALILVTWIGTPSTMEKQTAVLRIWPPPSPKEPSTSTGPAADGGRR